MTREANKKFIRVGMACWGIAAFIVIVSTRYHEELINFSPILSNLIFLATGVSGVLGFVFLVILGVSPHYLAFYKKSIANKDQARHLTSIPFLNLDEK